MNAALVTLQLGALLLSLPLLAMSIRTSRLRRSRHHGYMAMAALLALLASVLALLSLAELGGAEDIDPLLSFAPPLATLVACALVLRRGLQVEQVRGRRRRH